MSDPTPAPFSETMINLAHAVGVSSAATWFHRSDQSIESVLAWRAVRLEAFEREVTGHPDFAAIRQAWETGFDAEIDDNMEAAKRPAESIRPTKAADAPTGTKADAHFQALVFDVSRGIQTCLKVVESAKAERADATCKAAHAFVPEDVACLQRFAIAAATLLADRAQNHRVA